MDIRRRSNYATDVMLLCCALMTAHCTGSSTPPQPRSDDAQGQATAEAGDAGIVGDGDAADIDGAAQRPPPTGIRGIVRALEGDPSGELVAALPGSTKAVATARVDEEGRFFLAGLEPNRYRLVLPADGVHSTADLYAKLAPDAGVAEVEIPRSRGCPVTIKVRAHDNHLISDARLDFRLTDLPHVQEPHRVQAATDENGQLVVVGSCVRGFFEGTLTTPDGREYPFRHGYVGTGRDKFDIVLPGPDEPDGGVYFTNDE